MRLANFLRNASTGIVLVVMLCGCERDQDAVSAATTPLAGCRVKGIEIEIRCGAIRVPETRADNTTNQAASETTGNPPSQITGATPGRQIEIHFAVVPAIARKHKPDAIFIFAGGPGQSAISASGQVLPLFAKLNQTRDLVFIDQRGTGRSHPLDCPDTSAADNDGGLAKLFDNASQDAALRQCAQQLATDADLTQYTTTIAMQDIDAVRSALGYQRINLWGASYGTRAALEYLRQFGGHVRSATLDGVAPANMQLPLSFAVDADAALNQLIKDCAADAACERAHPQLAASIDQLFARLANGTIRAHLTHPVTGVQQDLDINRATFASWLRTPFYSATLASLVPLAISDSAQGNFNTLLVLNSTLAGSISDNLSLGMHLSVICAEDMTRITAADLQQVAGTRFGTTFYDDYRRLCKLWPAGRAPQAFFAPLQSDVPILMLSGGVDPATAARHANGLLPGLKNAKSLVAPQVGHGVSGQGCAPDLIDKFIQSADVSKVDGACLATLPRPPFMMAITPSTTAAARND
jgi:pimeloyl-ACP methyl ester carboxylesterase